jgi:hypothetical protein
MATPNETLQTSNQGRPNGSNPTPTEVVGNKKGRPTPTRKEAEAQRKLARKVPKNPREARKAMKLRQKQERAKSREGLMKGDPAYLPPRDAGPVKAAVRDFVDSRRSVGEFFIPIAFVILGLSLIQNSIMVQVVYWSWIVMMALIIGDVVFMVTRMRKKLRQQFTDPRELKGVNFYAIMRSLQIRRLRLPPPRVKVGGAPVQPKKPKQ